MPDVTVSADVDSMLRSANDAAIRTAIGLGQTDAPTFLAQSLTGQSLTGTQATSLVDLSATWNTAGNPSLIYGRVTNTNSGTTANLIDLGTFAGGSLFRVTKTGDAIAGNAFSAPYLSASNHLNTANVRTSFAVTLASTATVGWTESNEFSTPVTVLTRDAPGILAQRNGTNAQAFRVYNTYTDASNYERGTLLWTSNQLFIGTEILGTGAPRDVTVIASGATSNLNLRTGTANRWQINPSGHLLAATDNTYDIGASGASRPRNIFVAQTVRANAFQLNATSHVYGTVDGIIGLYNSALNNFDRLQLGGTTDVFPAIARDGAGIKFTGAAAGSTSWIKVPAVAVASLPAAATAGVGARAFVNDALTPVFGSAVAGGGAVTVPVYSTGSAWNVG